MSNRTITYKEVLTTLTCCTCGMEFAVPEYWEQERRLDHRLFYCPNGHGQGFYAETEEERLRKDLKAARREAEAQERRALLAERKAKKLENDLLDQVKAHMSMEEKIHAGICPYCGRNFTNVRRHMRSKHLTEADRQAEIASSKSA